jgi:hypothetical protein
MFRVHVCAVQGAPHVALQRGAVSLPQGASTLLHFCPKCTHPKLPFRHSVKLVLRITAIVMVNNLVQFSAFIAVLEGRLQAMMMMMMMIN